MNNLEDTKRITERIGDEEMLRINTVLTSSREAARSRAEAAGNWQIAHPEAQLIIESLIGVAVARHNSKARASLLGALGYGTIAESITESVDTRSGRRHLLKGELSILGSVRAHHARSQQRAASLKLTSRQKQEGIANTPIVYTDESTNLQLVELTEVAHCILEGISLGHSLSNYARVCEYLQRPSTRLMSLRENGVQPRATLEVDVTEGAVVQARGWHDRPLVEDSPEHGALTRSLPVLAGYLALEDHSLVVKDTILKP